LLLAIIIFYNYIASYEERLLEIKFAEEYNEYKKKTGKWLPSIGRRGAIP
jgi:protein-S-isoprenylcysteine O-methyltransferase Ste14